MRERPFHVGEREAQRRAGLDVLPGGAGIRDFMPDQHRLFFAELPFLVVATLDAAGAPTATLLTGRAGFVTSPDPRTLVLAAVADDPTGARLMQGAPVGLLGIEPGARRRNRANGRIAATGPDGLVVDIAQSFGNCPRYIHPRAVELAPELAGPVEHFEGLDDAARQTIATADTFFVATASGAGVEHGGVDVSHRGGPAGFVQLDGAALHVPDFPGNQYFNTLGNLLLEPRAALLFVDFAEGLLTQLQGRAEIIWGAERAWRFTAERGWRRPVGLRGRPLGS